MQIAIKRLTYFLRYFRERYFVRRAKTNKMIRKVKKKKCYATNHLLMHIIDDNWRARCKNWL